MSLLLLDTTLLIDAERRRADVDALVDDENDIDIAAVTLAELRVGVELATGRRRHSRQAFFDDISETVPVVDYDRSVAGVHAALLVAARRQGRPRGAHDLIIAATARATRRTVVTPDASAFDDLPGVDVRGHQ